MSPKPPLWERVPSNVIVLAAILGCILLHRKWPQAFAPVVGTLAAVMVLLTVIGLIRRRQKKRTG